MKNVLLRLSLIAFLAFIPAGCGFTPLYATRADGSALNADFQAVKVANIRDRNGQILRNDLLDRFYQHGIPTDPRYVLTIAPVEERTTDIDILPTSDASRSELRLITIMTLTDAKTGQKLLHRDLIEAVSYNILSSEFTTIVSQENVRGNALNSLAQQIETQLALYFAREKSGGPGSAAAIGTVPPSPAAPEAVNALTGDVTSRAR